MPQLPISSLRRLLAVLFLVCAGLASSAPAATADLPPCSPQQAATVFSPEGFPADPSNVRARRTKVYEIRNAGGDQLYGGGDRGPVSIVLRAVSGQPLSHPYSRTYDDYFTGDDLNVPVTLTVEDGPAVMVMSYAVDLVDNKTYAQSSCQLTYTSGVITPLEGRVTAPRGGYRDAGYGGDESVFVPLRLGECGGEELRIEVRFGGRTTTARAPSCKLKRAVRGKTGVRITGSSSGFGIEVLRYRSFSRRGTYRVRYAEETVTSGSFRVRGTHKPGTHGYRIYDTDFDNYVNVCLNGDYRLHASNGRLYCYVNGWSGSWRQHVNDVRSRS